MLQASRSRRRWSAVAVLGALVALCLTLAGAPAAAAPEPSPPPDETPGTPAPTAPPTAPDAPTTTVAPEQPTTTVPPAEADPEPAPAPAAPATLPAEAPEGIPDELWGRVRTAYEQQRACGLEPGVVCQRVLDWTGNQTLAEGAQWLVSVPIRIALVVALGLALNRLVRRAINRNLGRLTAKSKEEHAADPTNIQRTALRMATASSILGSAASALILGIAALIALSELGINLGPMLAGAGIAGIAIGFGAQNLVRDVLAGLFVIIEDQYGVGDIVDVGKAAGVVEDFSLRVTKLRDVEGTLWFVPNGEITEVGNKSQLWARAILDIEVAYGSDHVKAGEVIKAAADRLWHEQRPDARIIDEPELWGVERLGDSGVAIRLAVKSAPSEQFRVARVLRGAIKEALDTAGVEIPFPQRTIWVRSVDGASSAELAATAEDQAAAGKTSHP